MLSPTAEITVSPARIATLARRALMLELLCYPKPGLVSHVDSGSHRDMDADSFRRSANAIRPFFGTLAEAGAADASMPVLRAIGLQAEAAMMAATDGVNTHRGAIFGLGLLCAAAGARNAGDASSLGAIVAARWGNAILAAPPVPGSNGTLALRAHRRAGGARGEAAAGFPTARCIGLPALAAGEQLAPGDGEAARIHCLFSLMATVTDTNLLHRGGAAGLLLAQRAAQRFLADGGVGNPHWRDQALQLHRQFCAANLSPGGSADLLSMTLLARFVGERPGSRQTLPVPVTEAAA